MALCPDCHTVIPCHCHLTPPANRAALRDRMAHALEREDAINAGYDHGFVSQYGVDPETDGFVDAVLAVLPEHADRAAVLNAAADEMAAEVQKAQRYTPGDARLPGLLAAIEGLRRMADEAQPATAEAKRATPMTVYLATPCDACGHTLNWHRNDVGCTTRGCVCGRFQEPVAGAHP